jgi:hypothetical protein
MQFAFSYMYYVMHVQRKVDAHTFVRTRVDVDGDGALSGVECRLLALFAGAAGPKSRFDATLLDGHWRRLRARLRNITYSS